MVKHSNLSKKFNKILVISPEKRQFAKDVKECKPSCKQFLDEKKEMIYNIMNFLALL